MAKDTEIRIKIQSNGNKLQPVLFVFLHFPLVNIVAIYQRRKREMVEQPLPKVLKAS
jgi:hypothetical protein